MRFTLRIWRQKGPDQPGRFEEYTVDDIMPDMSILETLDILNEDLIRKKGAGGIRQRLPGRHLRHVRHGHQRHAPRAEARRDDVRSAHARFPDGSLSPWSRSGPTLSPS